MCACVCDREYHRAPGHTQTQQAPLARSVFVFECVSVSGRPVFREAVCAPREGGETVVLRSA